MRRNVFGISCLAAVCVCAAANAQQLPTSQGFVAGQVVVRLLPGQNAGDVGAEYQAELLGSVAGQDLHLFGAAPGTGTRSLLGTLQRDQRVAWAEMNFVKVAPGGGTQSFFVSVTPPQFQSQFARELLALEGAHQLATGQDVVVAVLDTGLDADHPLFDGRVAPGGYNFVDGNADFSDVGNGIDDNGNGFIDEMVGHGTFISGLVITTAPDAMILPVRVLNGDGVGSSFSVAQGIYHAIGNGADVINTSLYSIRPSLAVQEAVAYAQDAGATFVACVGNTDRMEPRVYPAAFPGVLAAAATDAQDLKAEFSDFGDYVHVSAPGAEVVSAVPGGEYGLASGTSYAAAFVSGTAAIVRSLGTPDPAESTSSALASSAVDIDPLNPGYEGLLGAGRLDAAAAATAAAMGLCDLNGDGRVDFFDFLTLQNWIVAGDPRGDINGDGRLDFFDMLEYQNRFLGVCQ